ncbi:MAG: 50S ribosomal protein L32e [Candidatus Marsarchaeota archaeon]|jgi:large subunit ribosomal protein L32e|nr:50S ribosomal protein L32e [Candidatus Marsarchaeota archaeon]
MFTKKKNHPKFNVPNFGAKNRKRVKERWRKQRGIDNKKRVKKAFAGASPSIGYGNPKEIKGIRKDGKKLMLIHNKNEILKFLEDSKSNNTNQLYNVVLASNLSKKKRSEIIILAKQNNIHIVNGAIK